MKNPLAWTAVIVVLVGAAAYYFWRGTAAPDAPAPPVAAAPAPAPLPVPEPPSILHPVAEPQPGSPPLPPLAESDLAAKEAMTSLFGNDAVARMFVPEGLVRRFVATIDNLPRKTTAQRLMPVRPVPGAFVVTGGGDALAISDENAFRYRPYVLILEAAEAKKLVATYVRLYPLFQAAYQELGYPNGYFNDRLVQAIDDLLAAPEVASPRLVQPKVLYRYADADLEDRSAGQKIMLRMGVSNAQRVKDKLRAIRKELTGQMTPR
ncbi:MAG: DUF3014 domain-containing protein [Burkholderiales bacterium]|nr:DUF3014 domain-containing protein [Burkholderiales bacterium]